MSPVQATFFLLLPSIAALCSVEPLVKIMAPLPRNWRARSGTGKT